MNKPRHIGQAILDISKTVMYKFHYDFIMENFPGTELLFTDTDSFCYFIPTDKDMYEFIGGNREWFDFSNYPRGHPNYDLATTLFQENLKMKWVGYLLKNFVGLDQKCTVI